MWWTVLIVVVVLFELWYGAAFFMAYVHMQERLLLLPVAQALLMLAAFAYLAFALMSGLAPNTFIVLMLLLGAMLLSFFWRRHPSGLALFLKSYPRGTLDVLVFRKPVADLKRRVRTK